MNSKIKIRSALVSVFDKKGIEPIIKEFERKKIIIYSTGGTGNYIKKLGVKFIPIEDITSYPSILGGRVKTLHPKVFGGILNRKNKKEDQKELLDYEIPLYGKNKKPSPNQARGSIHAREYEDW